MGYGRKLKEKAIQYAIAHDDEEDILEIADKFGIDRNTFCRWINDYYQEELKNTKAAYRIMKTLADEIENNKNN